MRLLCCCCWWRRRRWRRLRHWRQASACCCWPARACLRHPRRCCCCCCRRHRADVPRDCCCCCWQPGDHSWLMPLLLLGARLRVRGRCRRLCPGIDHWSCCRRCCCCCAAAGRAVFPQVGIQSLVLWLRRGRVSLLLRVLLLLGLVGCNLPPQSCRCLCQFLGIRLWLLLGFAAGCCCY